MRRRILIAAVLTLLAGCEAPPMEVHEFRSAEVQRRDIVVSVEAAGAIQPSRTVEVKSKASGEILSIHAETGDFVEEGSLLVQIDKRVPRNQLELVESQLDAVLSRRSIALAQLNRAERLFKSRSINEVDYEKSVLELANAKAEVVRSRISIENARFSLDDTEVNAPITGTVIEKMVEKGQVISSPTMDVGGGTVLMKMADLRKVQVQALIHEMDIGRVEPGQPVDISVATYPGRVFRGEVTKVEPMALAEEAVTTFPVLLTLDNDGSLLRPGMNADVEIFVEQQHDLIAVPTAALRTSSDIPTTASVLGIDEFEFRQMLDVAEARFSPTEAESTGRYWVLAGSHSNFEPVYIETGITDHAYTEVVNGIDVGASVLLLPSASLVQSNQRLQQRLRRLSNLTGISRTDN